MTVSVIGQGDDLEFKPFDMVCTLCGMPLHVSEITDLVLDEGFDESQSRPWSKLTVRCPRCTNQVMVPFEMKEELIRQVKHYRQISR